MRRHIMDMNWNILCHKYVKSVQSNQWGQCNHNANRIFYRTLQAYLKIQMKEQRVKSSEENIEEN